MLGHPPGFRLGYHNGEIIHIIIKLASSNTGWLENKYQLAASENEKLLANACFFMVMVMRNIYAVLLLLGITASIDISIPLHINDKLVIFGDSVPFYGSISSEGLAGLPPKRKYPIDQIARNSPTRLVARLAGP